MKRFFVLALLPTIVAGLTAVTGQVLEHDAATRNAMTAAHTVPAGERWLDTNSLVTESRHYYVATDRVPSRDDAPLAVPGIKCESKYALGRKIVLEFVGSALDGAEAKLDWTLPTGAEYEAQSDGKRLLVWAAPGYYEVRLVVTYTIMVMVPDPADATKGIAKRVTLPPYVYANSFTVGEAPTPTPTPQPDPAPTPAPTPELSELGKLVPNAAYRKLLCEFFADLASAVADGQFDTLGHFHASYHASVAKAKEQGLLPSEAGALTPIDKPVAARIVAAVGNDPSTRVVGDVKTKLASVLAEVANDFNR